MRCDTFEQRLEDLLAGNLAADESSACRLHAAGCAACEELLALAGLGSDEASLSALDSGFVDAVLARTSGGCGQVAISLAGWLDEELPAVEHGRVSAHLDGCADCRQLLAVLGALGPVLRRMAELDPGEQFAAGVLARTLPVTVRLRRWWAQSWPAWVRRPRFASEMATVGTLVLVILFAAPRSPLAAVSQQALSAARERPQWALGSSVEHVEQQISSVALSIESSVADNQHAVGRRWQQWRSAGAAAGSRGAQWARGQVEHAKRTGEARWGTFRGKLASLLERADDEAQNETIETPEETS